MAQNWIFQSAGTVVTGANPTVPLPATYSTGDLLVIVGVNNGGAALFSDPSGWTQATINQDNTKISIWYKFATASESSVVISNGSTQTKCVMLAYSFISAIDAIGTVNSATGTALTTTALTTTAADDLVISVFAIRTGTAQTLTAGSGYTARVTSSGGTTTPSLIIGDEDKATAGATTSRSATAVASVLWDTFAVSFSQVQTNTSNFLFMFN
ncbi:hypothetical protein A4F89_06615 [Polynucleobacter asymbioticus]|uniref:hypothetical protein n=1 Tax=Polynucleobacter asymbioticus TaxID=576611 RepID=UPI0008FAE7C0|nr:hypothetical protein [Polynucleobacter asymbioticus]APB99021.1 hypothetical protein A4F89_06615 [Polynucleobacter asymbioticus]